MEHKANIIEFKGKKPSKAQVLAFANALLA